MKIIRGKSKTVINARDQMYPSELIRIHAGQKYLVPEMATAYGVVDGEAKLKFSENEIISKGQSIFCLNSGEIFCKKGTLTIFTRFGFKGINQSGVEIENEGRLSYIDGCTDSLLIYPPRQGDPCVSALYFPKNTEQSAHAHPSIRLGYVLRGEGIADLGYEEKALQAGDAFCIDAFERHRFKTNTSKMVVIAYHPESDWGPTDEKHPMINRTYFNIQK